jgi:predicted secreted protein
MNRREATVIETALDEPVDVELAAPGSSGYRWKASFDDTRIALVGERWKSNMKSMGASAKQIFRFQPRAAGDHEIVFSLERPWEHSIVETRGFVIHARG